jgi:ribonuclease Z
MNWELYVLGANSAVPTIHRYPSGQVLQLGRQSILIDCGEGSQLRMLEYKIRSSRITTILISHLHGDHIFGLPGLLTSYNLFGRKDPLKIIGPQGIKSYVEFMMGITNHEFKYPVHVKEIKHTQSETVLENEEYYITAFPLLHRIPTYGYRIEEKITRIYLSREKVQELNLSAIQIKKILSGERIKINGQTFEISHLERRPTPRSYAYVSDTAYFPGCAGLIGPVRLMYHEATFLETDEKQAKERFHSTAREAALTALHAPAEHLLLGHYSSRYKDLSEFKMEAEKIFKPVSLALSGKKFTIPQEGIISELKIDR